MYISATNSRSAFYLTLTTQTFRSYLPSEHEVNLNLLGDMTAGVSENDELFILF